MARTPASVSQDPLPPCCAMRLDSVHAAPTAQRRSHHRWMRRRRTSRESCDSCHPGRCQATAVAVPGDTLLRSDPVGTSTDGGRTSLAGPTGAWGFDAEIERLGEQWLADGQRSRGSRGSGNEDTVWRDDGTDVSQYDSPKAPRRGRYGRPTRCCADPVGIRCSSSVASIRRTCPCRTSAAGDPRRPPSGRPILRSRARPKRCPRGSRGRGFRGDRGGGGGRSCRTGWRCAVRGRGDRTHRGGGVRGAGAGTAGPEHLSPRAPHLRITAQGQRAIQRWARAGLTGSDRAPALAGPPVMDDAGDEAVRPMAAEEVAVTREPGDVPPRGPSASDERLNVPYAHPATGGPSGDARGEFMDRLLSRRPYRSQRKRLVTSGIIMLHRAALLKTEPSGGLTGSILSLVLFS